jgi:hypothetical protein
MVAVNALLCGSEVEVEEPSGGNAYFHALIN